LDYQGLIGKTLQITYKIGLTRKTKTVTGELLGSDPHNILLRYETKQGMVEVWHKRPRRYDIVKVLDYNIFDIKQECKI
jgi:hypothetical protein